MALHVSLMIWQTVDFPIRYAKDNDCCDSPDARNHCLSPADMASRKFVDCFGMRGETKVSR